MKKRWGYDISVQDFFYGSARMVSGWILEYEELETSELCFDAKSVVPSWKKLSGIVRKTGKKSTLVKARTRWFCGALCR